MAAFAVFSAVVVCTFATNKKSMIRYKKQVGGFSPDGAQEEGRALDVDASTHLSDEDEHLPAVEAGQWQRVEDGEVEGEQGSEF